MYFERKFKLWQIQLGIMGQKLVKLGNTGTLLTTPFAPRLFMFKQLLYRECCSSKARDVIPKIIEQPEQRLHRFKRFGYRKIDELFQPFRVGKCLPVDDPVS